MVLSFVGSFYDLVDNAPRKHILPVQNKRFSTKRKQLTYRMNIIMNAGIRQFECFMAQTPAIIHLSSVISTTVHVLIPKAVFFLPRFLSYNIRN